MKNAHDTVLMHTLFSLVSPPVAHHPLPPGGKREGVFLLVFSLSNDAQCEAGLKHSCQAHASLAAPPRPEGRDRTRRVEARAPRQHPREGDTTHNDTHDCTTAPIINGRLPLHLQGR